ncbi:alpha/beta fold hydrolase [Mycolicibacterium sp. XJ870]
MTTKADQFTIHHDGVTIAVSRGGTGRPLVLCPGLTSTQAELCELIELLRHDYDVVTFDLRGHGLSSAADSYTFEAFLGDFTTVMEEVGRLGLRSSPVLAGHSLGADLIVHYAAENPDTVAELVLIDGANPLPAPFITEADLPEFRTLWENLAVWHEAAKGTPRQVLLTAQEVLELNLEMDVVRAAILERYRQIDCPVRMIMSTSMAGDSGVGRAARHNRLWRAGIERLVRARPDISLSWVDANHALVITHAPEIARIIRSPQKSPRPADVVTGG